jgi:hypothetical protein
MFCDICKKKDNQLHKTKCNHTFHLSCLQEKWEETSTFACPICLSNIGLVITESKQAYIVFEKDESYQCVYTVRDTCVKPTNSKLSKWQRNRQELNNRLVKRTPSVLLRPIVVR